MAAQQHRHYDDLPDDGSTAAKMGFLEHLDELRTRLIRSCIALGAGMLIAFAFVDRISEFVLAPAVGTLPSGTTLVMTRPGEGLSFYLDLALIGGVVLAAPFVTYQVWRFIAPGLYEREKRLIVPFVLVATLGTFAGALFSHYVLFPSMMAFFGTFDSPHVRFMPRLEDTFELYRNMLIAMVGVFQIPTLVFFLARMQLVTAGFLWRRIKYAALVSFILAAVLTPSSDPWNQTMFAVPIIGLYVISIGIAWIAAPRMPPSSNGMESRDLKLVFAATIINENRRRREGSPRVFPRVWRAAR